MFHHIDYESIKYKKKGFLYGIYDYFQNDLFFGGKWVRSLTIYMGALISLSSSLNRFKT